MMPGKQQEAQVGSPFEKVQQTLLDLARRIEHARASLVSFARGSETKEMTPLERRRFRAGIETNVRIIIRQCHGFADNRGVGEDFDEDVETLWHRCQDTGVGFVNWGIEMVTFCESWLERAGLLLNVGAPPRDLVEEYWEIMSRDDRLARKSRPPPDTAAFDDGLRDLQDENDVSEEEDDGDTDADDDQ